ncbi:unnamed protein product [Adineta ricciae]|uniref:Uncharacterized protein n=1 Tax=Adineta ricciae TaxID=249248 RepID=A0A816B5Y2_ADIRI|nr:unnamed protein product [Adineta ricciae]
MDCSIRCLALPVYQLIMYDYTGKSCTIYDAADGNVYSLSGHIIYMKDSTSVSIGGLVEATTKKTNTEEPSTCVTGSYPSFNLDLITLWRFHLNVKDAQNSYNGMLMSDHIIDSNGRINGALNLATYGSYVEILYINMSSTSSIMELWISCGNSHTNMTLISQNDLILPELTLTFTTSTAFYIGSIDGTKEFFDGSIDYVSITTRVKSTREILRDGSLFAYFAFTDGQVYVDSGPYGRNRTIMGSMCDAPGRIGGGQASELPQGNTAETPIIIPANQWSHAALTVFVPDPDMYYPAISTPAVFVSLASPLAGDNGSLIQAQPFDSIIDEFYMWSRTLNASEVYALADPTST